MPSGRFQQGESGNPAGKPKGARNRHTAALADRHGEKLEAAIIELFTRMADMDNADYTRAVGALMPYFYPKLKATEISFSEGTPNVRIEIVKPESK